MTVERPLELSCGEPAGPGSSGMAMICRATAAALANSSALALRPSVKRSDPSALLKQCFSVIRRKPTQPEVKSLIPGTLTPGRSNQGTSLQVSRPLSDNSLYPISPTNTSAPDSNRLIISGMTAGDTLKSAGMVIAKSRLWRSLRFHASRRMNSVFQAVPRSISCLNTVSGRAFS